MPQLAWKHASIIFWLLAMLVQAQLAYVEADEEGSLVIPVDDSSP